MVTAADRLALLYDVNRHMATFTDLDELLRFATRRVRELFGAEGCAVLILDRDRREFSFPIASQSVAQATTAASLQEVRFPADRGIAGWVVERDHGTIVADAQNDERFFPGVDAETGLTTRTILCAPLRTPSGNIGVLEVVNPQAASPTDDDLRLLEALADDFASAHERAWLYSQLRGEALSLRQICTLSGAVVAALGILLALGALVSVVALAVPVSEVLLRGRTYAALGAIGLGGFLLAVGRGWLPRR